MIVSGEPSAAEAGRATGSGEPAPARPAPAAGRATGAGEPTAARPAPAAGRTRVHVGEMLSAGAALLLLILMFAVKWYGVAGVPDPSYARPAVSGSEDGWHGLTDVRWVILVTILAAVGSVFLHASQRRHGAKTDTSRLIAGLGGLTSLLLVYRVLISLPGHGTVTDQKLGAILGLGCALVIAWGGYESIVERRARTGAAAAHRARTP